MNISSEPILPEDYYLADEGPLLEEMAEEDEEIDLYNEVTFGLDQDSADEDTGKTMEFIPETAQPYSETEIQNHSAAKPEVLVEVDSTSSSSSSSLEDEDETVIDKKRKGRTEDEVKVKTEDEAELKVVLSDTQEDEDKLEESELGDPAVMKAINGKPTLESLDSAVVDSGIGSTWGEIDSEQDLTGMDSGLWDTSPRNIPTSVARQILEDKAILRIMEKAPYIPRINRDFYGSPVQRGYRRSPNIRGPGFAAMSPEPFQQCFMRQSPMMHRSVRPPHPFTPPRSPSPLFTPNQSPGYVSQTPFRPMSPNISTPSRPMTPKMVRMHFGPMSPSPSFSPFFSPMANSLQRFRMPGHVTQLHPQHRRILSQRQQRMQNTARKSWERRPDPYACLMSAKEKEWVIKLQMIQLQSENPHLDDYYYQAYYEKLERKLAEEELLGERIKREPTKLVTPYIQKAETYEPVVHIEGSLGQVAVSTCYSPRRAIDVVSHSILDEDIKALGYQRLRVLKGIEKLFMMLLEVEEAEKKMVHVPEDQRSWFLDKQNNRVERIYHALKVEECVNSADESEDEFLQSLAVGKGKKLISRLIPYLQNTQAARILMTVAQHLTFLIKKDLVEESLSVLHRPLTVVISKLSFSELIGVLQEMIKPLPDSEGMPLTQAFHNQFGISLLYSLLSHGERLLSSDTPMEPCIGDFEKWTDMVFLVAKELSQVSKSSIVEPLFFPSNLLSLFCRYLDKQTIHRLEDKMECPRLPSYPAVPS
ncbi:protein PAT1 homolog 2 isoform X2 [Pleurodeles waltl]|uniref:protein PAT1 homolog 2 isoform X2 n=1 Tax=Pleurodeles waltl TaxID=8319 RepID=UPI00370999F2